MASSGAVSKEPVAQTKPPVDDADSQDPAAEKADISQAKKENEKEKKKSPQSFQLLAGSVLVLFVAIVVGLKSSYPSEILSEMSELDMPHAIKDWRHRGYLLNVEENNIKASIFVNTFGDPESKEAILFLHDAFLTSFTFKDTAETAERFGFFAVVFDFPGFGFSTSPEHDVGAGALWVGSVLDSLELSKVHIVAQGTAVAAACAYASNHTERVQSIVSFGASLAERIDRYEPEEHWLAKMLGTANFLALQHECEGHPDAAAANSYFVRHTHPSALHEIRAALLFPAYEHSCPDMEDIPRLWIAPGAGGPLVGLAVEARSTSVCLHLDRPNDFAIAMLSFIRPSVSLGDCSL
jgi:pimeloyl-ACP methyl ester carboxylesterase